MKKKPWILISAWALVAIPLLGVSSFIAEKADRGIVMRPVRKLANKVGINIPPPTLSAEEKAEARATAKAWKDECLKKYPVLKVEPHSVPDEENGFLMLYQLDKSPRISEEFKEFVSEWIYSDDQELDAETAKRLLEEHAKHVAHIEHIAKLTTRSSINMPSDYMGFIGARDTKQATELLMLKACLAADEGAEKEALHYITLTGNLLAHLREIETPFFLSETVAIIVERSRQNITLKHILPKLGKECDLPAWRKELARMNDYSPQRYATLIKGEWNTATNHMVFPLMAEADKDGTMGDAKACTMTYTAWMVEEILKMNAANSWRDIKEENLEEKFKSLPTEQEMMMSALTLGIHAWQKGFQRTARVSAQSLAALDLLVLGKTKGSLVAADAEQVSLDPITGKPFAFDPKNRTLSASKPNGDFGVDPLELPW